MSTYKTSICYVYGAFYPNFCLQEFDRKDIYVVFVHMLVNMFCAFALYVCVFMWLIMWFSYVYMLYMYYIDIVGMVMQVNIHTVLH